MDKWTEEQVKKMQFGGNEKAKAFLSKQSNWNAKASIKDKYTSRAAQNYREKVHLRRLDILNGFLVNCRIRREILGPFL